jgi:hypothetical protein
VEVLWIRRLIGIMIEPDFDEICLVSTHTIIPRVDLEWRYVDDLSSGAMDSITGCTSHLGFYLTADKPCLIFSPGAGRVQQTLDWDKDRQLKEGRLV